MKWEKKGLLFEPKNDSCWCSTHAGPPFVMENDYGYRVFFSGSNSDRISRIGFFDINAEWEPSSLKLSEQPIFDVGKTGCFDERGVAYPWIVDVTDTVKYLYYVGWIQGGGGARFFNALGLAISEDGGKTFNRYSRAPIFERTNEEPISVGSVCVRLENKKFKMWYTCIYDWRKDETGNENHYYTIRYAESDDGINWTRNIATSIEPNKVNTEIAIAKPSVIYENEIYKMWYSYRGHAYRIGYAESKDGIKFIRKDTEMNSFDFGRVNEWDSDMMEYSFVFKQDQKTKMLYCGNGFGKTGIGLAEYEPD